MSLNEWFVFEDKHILSMGYFSIYLGSLLHSFHVTFFQRVDLECEIIFSKEQCFQT